MGLIELAIIAVIIIVIVNTNKKNAQIKYVPNEKLKFCGACGYNLGERKESKFCPRCGNFLYIPEKKEKPKLSKVDMKNLGILIVGSILVVLSAIVFLTSTWGVTHSLVKTITIFALLGFFYGASYIAKKVFGLKYAAKTFFYLANAYLPFALLSILAFDLLGESFKDGPLMYGYITVVAIICSTVYKLIGTKDEDPVLEIASLLSSMLAIVTFVNILSSDVAYIHAGLFLYSVFLALLYEHKYYFYNEKITKIAIYTLSIASFFANMIYVFRETPTVYMLLLEVLVFIGGIYLCKRVFKNDFLFKFFYPLAVILICFVLVKCFELPYVLIQGVFILGMLITLFIDYIDCKTVINVFNYVLTVLIFLIISTLPAHNGEYILPSYLIFFILAIFSFLDYSFSKKKGYLVMTLLALFGAITEFSTLVLGNIFLGLGFALLLYVLSHWKPLEKYKNILHNLGLILTTLLAIFSDNSELLICFCALLVVTSIVFAKHLLNDKYKKYWLLYPLIYGSFILLSRLIVVSNVFLQMSVIGMGVWLILFLGTISDRFRNITTLVYGLVGYALIMLCTLPTFLYQYTWVYCIVPIFTSLMLIAYFIKNKYHPALLYIPLLCLLICYSGLFDVPLFGAIITIATIFSLVLFSTNKKNESLFVMPYLFTLILFTFDLSAMIITLVALFITVIYVINDKKNIFYQVVLEVLSLRLYYLVLKECSIDSTLLVFGILLPAIMIFTRYILRDKNYKEVFEYILLIVVCFIAATQYESTLIGLIFVSYLAILMVISYLRKYNAAMYVSSVAIVLNVVLLTYKYLINLPGWLYMLILGLIIIMFAVYNENKNKNKKK